MSLIKISNLTFSHEGSVDVLFNSINMQIDTDWKLGFIGRNGRGKTTFLHLLMGDYEYTGTISSTQTFTYFPFPINDKSQLTRDIVYEIAPLIEDWELKCELGKLKISDNTLFRPFDVLSEGEQTKILLATLFLSRNNFLLIDEPTNHLDIEAREIVGQYLNSQKGFILVSHDRAFLDCCVDHILSLNRTNIELQQGNFSSWLLNKKNQDNFELAKNEHLEKEICRLQKSAAQKSSWSDRSEARKIGFRPSDEEKSIGRRSYLGVKSKKAAKRRKSIEHRQEKAMRDKRALLKNIEVAEPLYIRQNVLKKQLLELNNVSIAYDFELVCQNISFSISPGDRVVLSGRNGCGKSSIIKLICGFDIPHSGSFEKKSTLRISYVPQDVTCLRGKLSDYAKIRGIDETRFKTILRKLDFSRTLFDNDMSLYSEGQKKKVYIAASLCEEADIHIWDEPLNYIDIFSRMQIEDMIIQSNPTLLFVEHDKAFCERVSTIEVLFNTDI